MSSQVYFDFHSPELFFTLEEDSWSKWYSKLIQLELAGKVSYFSERVSHLSNLIIENNIDAWELLQEESSGQVVDRSLIAKIITEWGKLYKECQKPIDSIYDPTDMWTAGQIKIVLKKYKGYHLVIRTD